MLKQETAKIIADTAAKTAVGSGAATGFLLPADVQIIGLFISGAATVVAAIYYLGMWRETRRTNNAMIKLKTEENEIERQKLKGK